MNNTKAAVAGSAASRCWADDSEHMGPCVSCGHTWKCSWSSEPKADIEVLFNRVDCCPRCNGPHAYLSNEASDLLPRGAEFYQSAIWKRIRWIVLSRDTKDGLKPPRCGVCGASSREMSFHVDHIYPASKFPALALDLHNLRILCAPCNIGRSNEP